MFSREFWEILKNTYFRRTPALAVSVFCKVWLANSKNIKRSIKNGFTEIQTSMNHFSPERVRFHMETSHLICIAHQMTTFYMKCRTWLNGSSIPSQLTFTCQWRRSGVCIVNFEHIPHLFLVFMFVTLDK